MFRVQQKTNAAALKNKHLKISQHHGDRGTDLAISDITRWQTIYNTKASRHTLGPQLNHGNLYTVVQHTPQRRVLYAERKKTASLKSEKLH